MTGPEAALLEPLRRSLGAAPPCRYLGLRAEMVDERLVVVLPALERHVGDARHRTLHGGVLAAFLEAAAWSVLDAQGWGDTATTVSFSTAFVRPAAVADTCAAVDVVRTGRRVAHVRVDAWQSEPATVVAIGQGTFALR